VPGTSGVTLASDWLNNNVSRWNLTSGKVETYDGSFQTKMERDVRMIRTSGKKGSNRKKEPDQVLMGTPIYAAHQRRVAAEAAKQQIPELPLEVTQLSKLDEYLEYPPMAWSMDYPLELEKYQESEEYLPIPPPGSSTERPFDTIRAVTSNAPRAAPAGERACVGSTTNVAPRTASASSTDSESSSPICELTRTPPTKPTVSIRRAVQTSRPQDSKFCKPGASPVGCLPAVAADNLDVQCMRVVGSTSVAREVLMLPDGDPGVSSSDSTDSVRTVPDTPPQTTPSLVRPVTEQSDQSPASSVEDNSDTEINPDSPFERSEIRSAQVADDSIGIVMAYCRNGAGPDKDEI